MKRTLALVLALIMILCMIPASMLTAFARGRGVYMNDVPNQTIPNAPGQYIPETVVIDGVLDDTGWREDDWKRVNSESGTWNVQYPTKNETINNETFAYKYNVRKDYYYLYGAFVVPTNEAGLVKLWLNNDAKGRNSCSHVFTFDITGKVSGGVAAYSGNGTWKRETADGVAVEDKSTYYFEKSKVVFQADGEFTNIEFKVLLADFCPAANPSIDYFVSVDTKTPVESDPNGDYEALYHPAIEIDEEFNRALYFPSMTNWVSAFAGEITTEDLNGLGEHSFMGDIDINGEFDEAEWAQHTDFYSRWYERTNVTDYKDNVNFMKPYSDLVYNKSLWNATSNWSAEHDLRVTANYIHGAALISVPANTTTNNIRFNMFQVVNENTIWQTTVYLHSSTGNYIDAAQFTFYENGVPVVSYSAESGDIHAEGYFNCNRNLIINNETVGVTVFSGGTRVVGSPGLYSFEFRIDRRFAHNFAPTVYDFCMAPDDTSRYWSCDNRYDGSTTTGDGNEQHPGYTKEAANLKQAYYPITHFNNQFGLDEIGASDAEVEYYEPYTLYTPDGYLGVKAWPGLTFSAGGPNNADFVNSGNSDRLKNLNYLHSLRSDYEFVYGALSVQAEADSPFKNWKLGTETSPNGGDYFTLWVMVPDETGTRYRFDIWAYENPNYDPNDSTTGPQYFAQIAGVDGNGNYVIEPETGAKAAFVNRENSADKDRYYAIEYKIALSSVQAKLNIGIDTTEQIADYLSTPIFEYYTSLSVANDDKTAYASMLWPRSGNGNLLPDDDGFLWNKEVNSNKIYGNPQALRYQDVIRVVEPDGRIVEELRFDLDDVNFSDSEYRDISKYSNFFTAKEEFYVGRDYAYLGAEIDGDVSSYNTKVILWIKTEDGTIHNYEFGHNGANATMKYDGNVVSDTTYVDQYGMTSTNGKTYFEAILDMDRFGSGEGFEYYIEIQQRVNGENLNRVFSDGTKKIILDTIDYGSQINTVKSWYQNAGHIEDLIHFPREEITIDGNLNDNGWDNGEWVYVSTDINANLQEADTHKDAFKTDFYYQLRVDDEYLYVAAVIFYSDCTYAANQTNITASEPGFRIWLKSGREGQNVLNGDSRTYTDYYGMYINKNGEIVFGSKKNTMPTYPNNTRNLYNKYYAPVVPLRDADGKLVYENGKVKYTYDAEGLGTAYTRFDGDTVYPSDLFGYTQYIINEQEANKNVNETEVLKGETINPEDYEKYNMLDHERTKYNVEQGIMRFGGDANYSQEFDHGRIETLGNDSTVVEFKVKLDEFGGHDEFQYIVTASSNTLWGGTRSTMYPAITSEAGSRDNYFHYYYPYWHWVDDTSVTVTEEVRADMTLLTYKRPVITLGAKVSKTYMYQGKETNALRMGGLWEEKYIRKTKELAENNGYWPDKSGDPNWVDYWDLKAMGMVVIPTYLLKENTNITSERPGKYDLFKGTKNSVWMDADGIVKWQGDLDDGDERNNYADYKNFAFYVTVVNVPTNVNFCFRGFADYYDEVLDACPSYYDVVLERSIDMVIDSAIRTEDNNKEEEDNALPPGEFSRDDESGFTGTDGSDYENSIDPSEDVSDDVSDDTSVAPGITTEENGASLDIAWPSHFHQNNSNQKYSNSLVFADSAGTGFSVGGFYAVTDSDGNTTTFPNTQLAYWKKLYFTQNADGTLTLQNIEGSGGTGYASWQINSGVMVVAYHPDDHKNAKVFDSYKVGETFVIEGKTLDQIGGTSPDTELKATLKRVIVCNHTSGWNPATCVKPETCKDCGAARPGSYPLGHKYDEDAKQTCTEGIKCTVCGFEKSPALGHTNGAGVWTYDDATHWWTCTREDCPEPNVKRNEAAHTFKNGKCSVCGYACEHPYGEGNFHEAVDATCGVSGNIAYYECECGLKFTDANCTTPVADVIIPALEHDYDEETGICNNCGDELTPTVVAHLEKAWPNSLTENGTNEAGNTMYKSYAFATDKNPDNTSGSYIVGGFWTNYEGLEGYPDQYPDNTLTDWWNLAHFNVFTGEDGRTYLKVNAVSLHGNGDYYNWPINTEQMAIAVHAASTEHYELIATLNPGDILYLDGPSSYADIGGVSQANADIDANVVLHKHKWVAATCTEPKHCRECGEKDPEDTALGHTPGAEATCTTAQLCTVCNAVVKDALGHSFTTYNSDNNATCTTNCTETAKCDRCDVTNTLEIENSALGHDFKTYVFNNNATCTSTGTETAKCERCNATDTRNVEGTPQGHSFTNYVYDDNATCTAYGTETAECDRNCGASDTRTTDIKRTHVFETYVFNNDAKCGVDGTETATCKYYGCGETHTRTKANTALGHEMSSEWTTDATYHWHVCTRCDYVFEDSKAEHNFVDGFCEDCEKSQFNPIELELVYPNSSSTLTNDDGTYKVLVFSFVGGYTSNGVVYKNHSLNGFDTTFPVSTNPIPADAYTLVALDMVGDYTANAATTKWEVVAIDESCSKYLDENAEFNNANTTTWNIGETAGADDDVHSGHRIVIAVPKAVYGDQIRNLNLGDYLEWTGGTDYTTTGMSSGSIDLPQADKAPVYLDLACSHDWAAVDCDAPETCSVCGATRGDALGHDWIDADCDTPKTCDRCGETEGEALGHSWVDADCDTPKTCSACGITEGEALGHSWVDATCTAPKTCSVCGETEGEALPHTPGTAADCENDQTCTVCGTVLANKLGHTPGAAATCTTAQTCTVCGEVIKSALGHTPGDPATCTTAQTCTVCGQVVVEALGHTPGAAATCTTDQICTVCGEVLVAALGHTWGENPEDGAQCTRCGETYVAFVPVQIPLTYANTDGSSTDIMVYAAAAHTKITGSSNNYQYWHMALLEYDDVSGKFRVVEVDPSGTTKYTSWYYGYDRIIIASWADNSNTTISTLKVDDYLELTGTTLETLKSASGSISATLTTVNYKGSGEITAPQVLTPIIKEPTYNKFVVAYVPLDDRPVHTSRVQLEAEAAGITLLMPNAADYRTHLYNASLGEEGHGGNTANILAWLKEQEANGVDFYVVALDQVFSGGLVNSRYSDPDFDGQLTPEDQDAADFLVELAKNNYVVYTDTIMRLASTYPYKDHTEALYTMLRDYGQGKNYYGQSNRIVLDENGVDKYALTLEHVISSYRYSSDGTSPIGRYFQVGSSYYNLEDNVLNGYLGARERKLRITDYMLRNAGANINHYYIGMDDSAEGETIQKNEQRYIDMVIKKTGANAITFAGADEMSVMGISAITNYLVNTPEAEKIPAAEGWEVSKIPVNVVYFGDGANWQADTYDSGDLGPAINLHLKALDAYQVDAEYANDPKVIQLVVVTRGTEQYSFSSTYTDIVAAQTQVAASKANADAAAAYIKEQLTAHKPVAIIDVTYWNAIHLNFVAEAMRNAGIFDMPEFTEILGYSTWNTAGNAIGLAMGQAFSRYNYIMNTDLVSKSSNVGFLKMLAYSFVKDAAYRTNSFITDANGYYWSMNTSSQKTYIVNDGTYNYTIYTTAGFTGNEFLGYVNKNNARILLKDGVSTEYYNHNISIHTPVWPANWGPRSFECWFTVEGTSDEPENGDIIVGDGVALPDEDFQ